MERNTRLLSEREASRSEGQSATHPGPWFGRAGHRETRESLDRSRLVFFGTTFIKPRSFAERGQNDFLFPLSGSRQLQFFGRGEEIVSLLGFADPRYREEVAVSVAVE